MNRPLISLPAILLLLAAGAARADPPELVDGALSASVSRTGPHTALVCAKGRVMTGGYSQPTLKPAGGHDGVYDLAFMATPPEGIHTDMVSEINARLEWTDAPADLRAVRVRGAHATIEARLGAPGGC